MANRTRPIYEATRRVRWRLGEIGRELRLARISAGMRQADVARQLGTSTSRICRVEHGQIATLRLPDLARHAATVGLTLSVKLYPLGRRPLDRPQLDLLGRFKQRLHPAWSWRTEVPIPIAGDLRSGDCIIAIPGCTILVEAYTRFSDYQAQTASAARKKRDLGADRLIILVGASHANRRALAAASSVSAGSFPLGTKATLNALADGRDPGADAIVFL
jgi:transcriptional regulator with XRE-family HTH domain